MFSHAGAHVIELFSPLRIRPSFWLICQVAGVEYDYVMGQVSPNRDLSLRENCDYTVDVAEVIAVLKRQGMS